MAASTSSLSPEPNRSVSSPLTVGATPSVREKMTAVLSRLRTSMGPWLSVECHLVRGVGRQRGVLAAIDRVVRNRRWPLYERGPHLDPTRQA